MDSIIPLGQKNTLVEYMILSGADNRPPMLDKDLYDSWKSIMELYMQNREHERMILESVKNGPLICPTIEENRVTRTKKYVELSTAEKIQADYDMKATNIILQGTSLTKQEIECKLYDAFYKFTHIKGGSLHTYYLRFTHLINDMNIYKMKMEQFQVNTKFLNSLPPEWSKFVTDVKLVKDLHTSNFDQLHAYLEQHELHANEVRLLRERNQDPVAFVANQQIKSPYFNTYQSSYYNPQLQQQCSLSLAYQYGPIYQPQQYSFTYLSQPHLNHSSVLPSHTFQSQMNHQISYVPQTAYHSPQVPTQPMTELPLADSGLVVPVFSLGDDPIACLNKAMTFLTPVASSRFPSTNNQLRTSSNPRNQATIQDGRVTVQQVQGRQGQSYYGEGHMARQCTQSKRPRNAAWYKDKAMLAEAQEAGQILDAEQLAFLADPGILDGQAVQTIIPNNAAFQTEDLDTYDSDCDDISNAKAVLMANISNYGFDVISEVPHSDTYLNEDMENQSVHAMQDFEQTPVVDFTDNKIHSDSIIIPYSQYLQETQQVVVQETNLQAQQDSIILSVIKQMLKQMINHVNNWEKANKEQNNESVTAELERYKERVKTFEQRLNIDLSSREKMIDSQMDDMIKKKLTLKEQVDSLEQNLSKQIKEKEYLLQTFTVFKNESKEKENKYMENKIDLEKKIKKLDNIIYKVGYQNLFYLKKDQLIKPTLYEGIIIFDKHVDMYVIHDEETLILEEFDSVVKKRTTPDARTECEWGFEHTKAVFNNEIIPFLQSLKDIFNVFDKYLLNEIIEVQTIFDQMEAAVQQSSVDKQCLVIDKKELLLENDRLLQQIMSQYVLLTVKKSMSVNVESVNVETQRSESCDKCLNLEAEFLKLKQAYNDLLKNYSQLGKHYYFKNNDLKAQLQDKDTAIYKLKETIKPLRKNNKEENVNHNRCELETINGELENSVAKLLSKNELLCKEINHVKQVFKDQFDSIKRIRVRTKEQSNSLINKLNLKSVENEDLKAKFKTRFL
ncbi:hypothetical protein Tco_0627811 [Tanacetum coccineum]|uniref:Integrase, catalytic region, zinc finger, CCHC-type, peptidase aspartic, catalytic n=1 Tax=Tanacetum coccineum TaxID=301880 RepID=A0ABQ4WNH7_9ASTR